MWIPQGNSPRSGNNVDFSQRFAEEPDDEATRQAIMTLDVLRKIRPEYWRLHDDEELQKLFEELREAATNGQGSRDVPEEEADEPLDYDKVFDIEDMRKQIPKRL